MKPKVEIIVLAAGAARRMRGSDKLLESVDGHPLIRQVCKAALASSAHKTYVVLPSDKPLRLAAVSDLNLGIVYSKDANLGMSASLKAGLAIIEDPDAVLVMLADMPEITTAHINSLIRAFGESPKHSIIRGAAADETPGHPVLFGSQHFDELLQLSGDFGAKDVIEANSNLVKLIKLDADAALTDLDTPEDWRAWRSKNNH